MPPDDPRPPDDLRDLVDDYLSDLLDETRLGELEARLRSDHRARAYFVRYARLHTDLHLTLRARLSGKRALESLASAPGGQGGPWRPGRGAIERLSRFGSLAAAAAFLLVLGVLALRPGGWGGGADQETGAEGLAWLLNAQDCRWAEGMAPGGDMGPGRLLRIERGLAELAFRSGARLLLEAPATLELISAQEVRLLCGKAAARVPPSARGFTVLSPRGKVVDRGTEFGISVAPDGTTEVFVFQGQVSAEPAGGEPPAAALELGSLQAAVLDAAGVTPRPDGGASASGGFVRQILPPRQVVPRRLQLDFRAAREGTLRDAVGAGTGFPLRLPGTGGALPRDDPHLRLHPAEGRLELTATDSDINTQHRLQRGEYPGLRLSALGFTGKEDFEVKVAIPDIPSLEFVGQFGLFAGASSDKVIRGGLISRQEPERYSLFLVNNHGGRDSDLHTVGFLSTGDDLLLTLRRQGGKYSLAVENLTTGSSSTLAIRHPSFLDEEGDLLVGLFAANPRGEAGRTLNVKDLEVTVWTEGE